MTVKAKKAGADATATSLLSHVHEDRVVGPLCPCVLDNPYSLGH